MTNKVLLRDVTENDLPIFFEQQLEPLATQLAAFPSRDRGPFMELWARLISDDTIFKQTILFNGHVAGNIVSWEQSGEREVGYWIGKEYWGKGVATQALSKFLIQVKQRPLYAHVAKNNIGSFRVLQKCGFAVFSEDPEEYILKLGMAEEDNSNQRHQ
jgi:RimJ/RimL family protein N-acetyltransferase